MQIPAPPRKPRAEAIVPMINVVFLLLVFFLMTAQIAPPEPFPVALPEAEQQDEPANGYGTLYLSAEGVIAYRDLRGDQAIAQAVLDSEEHRSLDLRADAASDGATLAGLVRKLTQAGAKTVTLITVAR